MLTMKKKTQRKNPGTPRTRPIRQPTSPEIMADRSRRAGQGVSNFWKNQRQERSASVDAVSSEKLLQLFDEYCKRHGIDRIVPEVNQSMNRCAVIDCSYQNRAVKNGYCFEHNNKRKRMIQEGILPKEWISDPKHDSIVDINICMVRKMKKSTMRRNDEKM